MKRLGHSSISTTKIYSQFYESRLESDFHLINKNNEQKNKTNHKQDRKQSGKSNNQDNSGYYQSNQQVVYNA